MIIDLYAYPFREGSDVPRVLSIDQQIFYEPEQLSCPEFVPVELIQQLQEALLPGKPAINGVKNKIQLNTVASDSIMEILAEANDEIDAARGKTIEKYTVSSQQNIDMMRVQHSFRDISAFLQRTYAARQNVLVTTHNANPTENPGHESNSTSAAPSYFASEARPGR